MKKTITTKTTQKKQLKLKPKHKHTKKKTERIFLFNSQKKKAKKNKNKNTKKQKCDWSLMQIQSLYLIIVLAIREFRVSILSCLNYFTFAQQLVNQHKQEFESLDEFRG